MNLIRYIYKTRILSEYGRFIFISLLLIIVAGYLFIPEFQVQNIDAQLLRIKGKYIKFSDDPHMHEFIRSVKHNKGYICLGTSETTTLKDGNYYDFLDQDTSYSARFSKLGGAGWTCGLHMPMLINCKEDVDSLNLIYFINPVYWRSELNGFDKGYWIRYLNYGVYKEILNKNNYPEFLDISQEYDKAIHPGEKLLYRSENWLRKIRKPFFHDLRYYLFPDKYYDDLSSMAEDKTGTSDFAFFGESDTAFIDCSWNVSYEFKSRTWLNPISNNDYRNRELKAFINLCKDLNVKVTYILGPVNEIYIKKYQASYLGDYQKAVSSIRNILEKEDVDFIDASDIGTVPGSFMDNQHHSSYGAFLIYQKIKKHLHEKDGL